MTGEFECLATRSATRPIRNLEIPVLPRVANTTRSNSSAVVEIIHPGTHLLSVW